jgi:hypothetical protein
MLIFIALGKVIRFLAVGVANALIPALIPDFRIAAIG